MATPTLKAEGLGKAYRIYRRPLDSLKELVFRRDYAETFWALKNINLEVARGASLGIVGDNGAGKTTLLKLLAGAASQTEGTLERNGRTSAILSLGAGFHPDLSGTENIRIGCAVMGMSPAETDEVLPRIVEFSELGDFVHRPVKTYSSGMYLRLGFSVATVTRPDLLIVDEHLSVGDQHFRHKCMRRIMDLREGGCSLVFCSHDLHAVGEVCERTLWIKDGRAEMMGPTDDVLKVYQDHVRARDGGRDVSVSPTVSNVSGAGASNAIESVELLTDDAEQGVHTGQPVELRIRVRMEDSVRTVGVHFVVVIVRNDGLWCYGTKSRHESTLPVGALGGGRYEVGLVVPALPLLSGKYSFTVAMMDDHSPHAYDHKTGVCEFTVRHDTDEVGVVRIPHSWRS